ncbi:alpha/beta fold hydrolase [Gordonia sp. NPDC003424]
MGNPDSVLITTDLGRLHVRRAGSGPPVVLWHSLFVDSRSWGPLFDEIASQREVFAIDGPCHGGSDPLDRDFTFPEVIDAAVAVLDELGVTTPVDWVGNAWGGHIGIQVAADHPERVHTVTTIGCPLRALSAREKWILCWPLVQLYRVTGPTRWLTNMLSDKLIGAEASNAEPDRTRETMAAFTDTDRRGMLHAMNSMMLHRKGIEHLVTQLRMPTLMLAAADDTMGCSPAELAALAGGASHVRTGTVRGGGHVAPLLIDTEAILHHMDQLWSSLLA